MNRKLLGTISAVVVAATTMIGAATADAAAAGWTSYNWDAEACSEATAYRDGYGRITQIYFDLTNNCVWDTLARDTDLNGAFEQFWFDIPEGRIWDAVIVTSPGGGQTWYSMGPSYDPFTYPAFGINWTRSGFLGLGVISAPTAPSGFYQLMQTLAGATRSVAWGS